MPRQATCARPPSSACGAGTNRASLQHTSRRQSERGAPAAWPSNSVTPATSWQSGALFQTSCGTSVEVCRKLSFRPLSANISGARLYDTDTGTWRFDCTPHHGLIYDIAWSPGDGFLASVAGDGCCLVRARESHGSWAMRASEPDCVYSSESRCMRCRTTEPPKKQTLGVAVAMQTTPTVRSLPRLFSWLYFGYPFQAFCMP
jgi:hypothetical protein